MRRLTLHRLLADGVVEFYQGRDRTRERQIWVTVALSLIIHALVLWGLPKVRLPALEGPELGEARGPLVVRLAPPPAPPQLPSLPSAPAVESVPSARVRPAPAPRPAPPVMALKEKGSRASPAAPSAPPAAAPVAPRPAVEGDLSSYIEARRRARGDPAPAVVASGASSPGQPEDDKVRADRLAAANLASQRPPIFGYDPRRSGGIFQIERLGYDSAEFLFYGWNREIRRNTAQLIEVRRGDNTDIRLAVVRKMIAIIRDYEQEDFLWESRRLGRSLTLSARARDTAGLEEFLMREFFSDPRRP